MSTVRFNVGGRLFETCRSTIQPSSYLRSLCEHSKDDHPIFVDRDPDGFQHVLELLRDPAYPFPSDCNRELHFYGILTEPAHPLQPLVTPPTLLHTPTHQATTVLQKKLHSNPSVSVHRLVFHQSLHSTLCWDSSFGRGQTCVYDSSCEPTPRTICSGLIFLPLGFTRLKEAQLTLIVRDPGDQELRRNSYHLSLAECDASQTSLNDWKLLPVQFEHFQNELGFTVGAGFCNLRLELQLPCVMDAGIQVQVLRVLDPNEISRMQTRSRLQLVSQMLLEHDIGDAGVTLQPGAIRAICWRTRKPVPQVVLQVNGRDTILTPNQFRLHPSKVLPEKCGWHPSKVLPEKCGCIHFCREFDNLQGDTGYLFARDVKLVFPPDTQGRVWQFNFTFFEVDPGCKVVLKELGVEQLLAPPPPPPPEEYVFQPFGL